MLLKPDLKQLRDQTSNGFETWPQTALRPSPIGSLTRLQTRLEPNRLRLKILRPQRHPKPDPKGPYKPIPGYDFKRLWNLTSNGSEPWLQTPLEATSRALKPDPWSRINPKPRYKNLSRPIVNYTLTIAQTEGLKHLQTKTLFGWTCLYWPRDSWSQYGLAVYKRKWRPRASSRISPASQWFWRYLD